MINIIPILGWLIDFCAKVSLAIPFYIIWTGYGIGQKYFYFLPEIYLTPGFWDCVDVFIVLPIVKAFLTPHFVNVTQTNTTEDKK